MYYTWLTTNNYCEFLPYLYLCTGAKYEISSLRALLVSVVSHMFSSAPLIRCPNFKKYLTVPHGAIRNWRLYSKIHFKHAVPPTNIRLNLPLFISITLRVNRNNEGASSTTTTLESGHSPLFRPHPPYLLMKVAPEAQGSPRLSIRAAPYSQATRATCKPCKLHTLLTVSHSPHIKALDG